MRRSPRRASRSVRLTALRVTDAPTLDVVVSVLAGAINTRLVAARAAAGGRPVGLTGADADVVAVKRAAPVATVAGPKVDLGLVGQPIDDGAPNLVTDLLVARLCAGDRVHRRDADGTAAERQRRHAGVAPGGDARAPRVW